MNATEFLEQIAREELQEALEQIRRELLELERHEKEITDKLRGTK